MSWGTWCCCFLCTLTVNVVLATDTSCPTWHYYNNVTGVCECGFGLICSSDGNQVEIRNGHCATSAGHENDYFVGKCLFSHPTNRGYSEMPSNASQLDEAMCGPYNRKGLLCGECEDGYGVAVYSLDLKCANCSSLWFGYATALYLLFQFVLPTFIFICSVVSRFNITSGPLLGYVLFCQISMIAITYRYSFVYYYLMSHLSAPLKFLLVLSVTLGQFWNLQFLKVIIPPFCISDKLTGIHVLMLNFIPTLYPFVLVIISCILTKLHGRNYRIVVILWKPFKIILRKVNITAVNGDAVFHTFASFLFLSNTSVTYATFQVLHSTTVHTSTGLFTRKALYLDPTVEWPSQKSVMVLIISFFIFISVSQIPSILLCIYPSRVYRYLSRFLSARKRLAITAFAEALHSCFKDGLNGTRDYRALAGGPIFLTLSGGAVNWLLSSLTDFITRDIVAILLWMMFVCLVSYVKPCKSAIANVSLSFHMALLGIFMAVQYLWRNDPYVGSTYTLELTFIATLLTPHILVALWVGYTLTKYTLTRFGYQFHGPGCKMALSDMANGVRLCLYRRHRGY